MIPITDIASARAYLQQLDMQLDRQPDGKYSVSRHIDGSSITSQAYSHGYILKLISGMRAATDRLEMKVQQ